MRFGASGRVRMLKCLRTGLDLLYPRNSALTGLPVDEGSPYLYLTEEDSRRFYPIRQPLCPTCGHPFHGDMLLNDRICPHCEELDPQFEQGRCGYVLRGAPSDLLHQYKYGRAPHLAVDLGRKLAEVAVVVEHLRGTTVVPVPLHPRKLRERGFDQVALLLGALAEALPGEWQVERLLVRSKDDVSQTTRSRSERLGSVRRSFALAPAAVIDAGLTYTIFDDVFTTGATLNACARVLRRAGATRINVAAFAHG